MMQINNETRLIDLNVGQLMQLITNSTKQAQAQQEQPQRELVYGMAGIASIFNCSLSTANRIKQSGKINAAITQRGRIIVVDVQKALELFNNK